MNTYELMQLNRSQLLEKLNNKNHFYTESEFDHYSMFPNPKGKTSMYKTHDERAHRENSRKKEKRINKLKQNSMKDLANTLKRVKSKQLTQRGKNRINNMNIARSSSNKFIHNLNNTQ